MRRLHAIFLASIFLFLATNSLQAQYKYQKDNYKYHKGLFGYGGIGYTAGKFTNLESTLEATDLVCTYCNTPQVSVNLGGGFFGLVAKRYVFEGKAYGHIFMVTESENTKIRTTGASAYISTGYAAVNRDGWLIYPSIGFGVNGYTMKIQNKTDINLYFGDDKIPPSTRADFRMGVPMVELKVGINKMIKKMSRVAVGLDIGVQFNVAETDWKNIETGELVSGINSTGFNGFFMNLTIGGGRFLMTKETPKK